MESGKKIVLYDYRESRSGVPGFLTQLGITSQSANLRTDYVIGNDCWVERKTVNDFISSIVDGRLFRQVVDLSRSCKHPLFLLEGGGLYRNGRVPSNIIRGSVMWITFERKVPLIRTYSSYDTACTLRLIAQKESNTHSKDIEKSKLTKNDLSPWQQEMRLLIQIPGIGWQTAKDILSKAGSVSNLSKILDSELLGLKRFGKKRLKNIRQFFPQI